MQYLVRARAQALQLAFVQALRSLGIESDESSEDVVEWAQRAGERLVALVLRTPDDWALLSEAAARPGVISVALLPTTTPLEVCAALQQGFAVVDATESAENVALGIQAAASGHVRISIRTAQSLCGMTSAPHTQFVFSPEEIKLLQALADGMTLRRYAEMNFVSPRTLSRGLRSIAERLGAANRSQLLKLAAKYGLVS